jgi:two-component system cell cycle sensor histidine kinase/response regulator CckA
LEHRDLDEPHSEPLNVRASRATILVVDDEESIRRVAQEILLYLGFEVETARSGEDALERIAQGTRPDLILLDVVLPGMGGVEAFARIRRVAPQIPVIITSGYANRSSIEWLIEEGASGFVAKPYGIETLSERIRVALG